jgi:hypothetical protein
MLQLAAENLIVACRHFKMRRMIGVLDGVAGTAAQRMSRCTEASQGSAPATPYKHINLKNALAVECDHRAARTAVSAQECENARNVACGAEERKVMARPNGATLTFSFS